MELVFEMDAVESTGAFGFCWYPAALKTVSGPYYTFAPERRMMSAHFPVSARTNAAN